MGGWVGRRVVLGVLGGVVMGLGGCGVPREAVSLARVEAGVTATMPAGDAEVRAALRREAGEWEAFAGLLGKKELFGVMWVDPRYAELAGRVAAVARRQQELMDAGTDDPAKNRELLAEFGKLWGQAEKYLER